MTASAEPPSRIDLAQEPDFELGRLRVSPSACRVRGDGADERVEPRVMEVLLTLVRAAGRTVSRDQLVEACWGGRIVSDDAVTRVIAKVRSLARLTEPAAFALQTVPKVGFRLEPAGAGPESPGDAARLVSLRRRLTPRGLAVAAAGLAILLLVGFLAWRTAAGGGASGQNGRVEVVRFESLQPDPQLTRLSAAVTESVIQVLDSSGIDTAPRPVARDTGRGEAELRIAGSVDRDGDRYVVNGQIIDRRSGLVLWAGRTDRPVAAAAGLPAQAAQRVAGFLHCGLEQRERAKAHIEPPTFGLFLEACAALAQDSPARALHVSRRLVQARPDLAGGHGLYALAAALEAGRSDSPSEVASLRADARKVAERALKMDPDLAMAHAALAISYGSGGRWTERERHLRRAIALDANLGGPTVAYGQLLREVGRTDEARELLRRVYESDPTMMGMTPLLAMMLAASGDLREANRIVEAVELTDPDIVSGVRWTIAVWWEPVAAARPKLRSLGEGWASDAQIACIETHFDGLLSGSPRRGLPAECADAAPDWRVRLLARQGDVDGAFAILDRPRPNSRSATFLLFYPEMKPVRHDPRFMPLAKRLGLVDYWLATGSWPDFCAEPDLPYDCEAVARRL